MRIPIQEGYAPFRDYQTWYRVTGDLRARKTPVVILHGGPGAAHDHTDAFKLLANGGRAVIQYDQLGCGRSTHLRDKGADFWTPRLFLDELENLTRHLGIDSAYHVLGQSWGGMLGAEHAVTRPKGLRSLVISDSPASMELWVQEANRLREDLPPEVQATLLRHERAGTFNDPEYLQAAQIFYDRHVMRIKPTPPHVQRAMEQVGPVYYTMNGPSEFHVIGNIKDWDRTNRLSEIRVPTLITSGRHDESTPLLNEVLHNGIAGSQWSLFEQSSHMAHVEERESYLAAVKAFIEEVEAKRK